MTDDVDQKRYLRWRFTQQLPLLVALVVLWMLLWGEVTLLSVGSGFLVALVVTRLFYLPPVELSGRFNVLWFLAFLARFAFDVVVGSAVVAWQAVSPRRVRTNAIIGVPLRTSSDFVLTMTATVSTLVPGSVVIEVDRDASVLYLHVLGVPDERAIDRARSVVLRNERALVRAVGSRDDLAKVMA